MPSFRMTDTENSEASDSGARTPFRVTDPKISCWRRQDAHGNARVCKRPHVATRCDCHTARLERVTLYPFPPDHPHKYQRLDTLTHPCTRIGSRHTQSRDQAWCRSRRRARRQDRRMNTGTHTLVAATQTVARSGAWHAPAPLEAARAPEQKRRNAAITAALVQCACQTIRVCVCECV